ncbi:twin-arginine translocation signal domain-containing protein (plasmid) [Halococcus dombrowskii]|uniref:Twin-arginine translocation signal domain-containing protein n=1 Tax=Halococcus dombrowskii TaxID=179637 RepID=A0AAV3SGW8_HALDO|nr:twin-arginine translocation signal domain-containing protein [Halococcus dombrowskii]UOO97288.1 twin-arginine translocation signal domain-containing protein [Halococcus dombrowskii]
MTDPNQSSTNRRQFLAAAATAGLALLAGCGSTTGSNNSTNGTPTSTPIPTTSGPARFARAALLGPSTVTLGKPFRLTLEVANVGGETGTLTTNIQVSDGRSDIDQPIERTIDPGERVKIQTDPVQFDIADSYTFNVGISKVSHTVSVQPKTAAFGTTFDLSNRLKGTVKSIEFHPSILYSPASSDQSYLQKPSSDQLLAVIRADLKNVGSQTTALEGSFELTNGELRQTLGSNTPLNAAKIDGTPLIDLELSPRQQRSGWLLGEIPRPKARKAVSIIYQRDTVSTPPEFKWTSTPRQGTRNLPQFTVENFQLPNTAMQGEDATANVTISNEGNSTRTFQGLLETRVGENGDWRSFAPITTRVRPGQSTQQNVTINSSSNGSVSYRLAPLDRTGSIEYVPPTFAFGESYTTTENVEVTLSEFRTADTVAIENNYPDSNEQVSPPTGERFILVHVEATAVGRSGGTPFARGFSLRNGSKTFEQASAVDRSLVTPVEGSLYSGVYDPDENETFSGYLAFSVPQQVPLGELTVEWTSADDSTGGTSESARWTKGGS